MLIIRFRAKSEDYAKLTREIHGRYQHPIIPGSGTRDYEGVTGRFDFRDNIENLKFPY